MSDNYTQYAPLPVHHRRCADRVPSDPCICDEISAEDLDRLNPWRKTAPATQPGLDGPPCIWCNSPTRRAGTCYVCPMCGNSTSC